MGRQGNITDFENESESFYFISQEIFFWNSHAFIEQQKNEEHTKAAMIKSNCPLIMKIFEPMHCTSKVKNIIVQRKCKTKDSIH